MEKLVASQPSNHSPDKSPTSSSVDEINQGRPDQPLRKTVGDTEDAELGTNNSNNDSEKRDDNDGRTSGGEIAEDKIVPQSLPTAVSLPREHEGEVDNERDDSPLAGVDGGHGDAPRKTPAALGGKPAAKPVDTVEDEDFAPDGKDSGGLTGGVAEDELEPADEADIIQDRVDSKDPAALVRHEDGSDDDHKRDVVRDNSQNAPRNGFGNDPLADFDPGMNAREDVADDFFAEGSSSDEKEEKGIAGASASKVLGNASSTRRDPDDDVISVDDHRNQGQEPRVATVDMDNDDNQHIRKNDDLDGDAYDNNYSYDNSKGEDPPSPRFIASGFASTRGIDTRGFGSSAAQLGLRQAATVAGSGGGAGVGGGAGLSEAAKAAVAAALANAAAGGGAGGEESTRSTIGGSSSRRKDDDGESRKSRKKKKGSHKDRRRHDDVVEGDEVVREKRSKEEGSLSKRHHHHHHHH